MKAVWASFQTGRIGQRPSLEQVNSCARHFEIAIGPSISSMTSFTVIVFGSTSNRTPPPGPRTPMTQPWAPSKAIIWGKKFTGISCLLAIVLDETYSPEFAASSTKALTAYSVFFVTSTSSTIQSRENIYSFTRAHADDFLPLTTKIILIMIKPVKNMEKG